MSCEQFLEYLFGREQTRELAIELAVAVWERGELVGS